MGRPEEQPSDLYGSQPDYSDDQQPPPPPYGQPQNPPPPALYQQQPPPPPPSRAAAQYPPPHMNPPPPESYPPQKPPPPAAYPPQRPPPPAAFPPPQQPAAFPPAQQYPGPQPSYQPPHYQQQAVQFPPPQQQANYGGQVPQSPMKPAAHGIPVGVGPGVNTEGWRTGLFDCLDDPTNAAITFLFPCLTFGQIAEIVDNGQTSCGTGAILYALIASFIGLPCIYSCTYRTKLRSKFGLVEAPAPDWLVHFVCEPCALCQAYRELNLRGLDPAIGWMGNVARSQQQQQQVMMTPPQNQAMYN